MRPTMILILSPIALLLSTYCAFMFGLVYLLITTFPAVFEDTYHWGPGIAGLAYLGLGIGMIFSVGIFGILSDKLLHQPKQGTVARPELRLLLMMWLLLWSLSVSSGMDGALIITPIGSSLFLELPL